MTMEQDTPQSQKRELSRVPDGRAPGSHVSDDNIKDATQSVEDKLKKPAYGRSRGKFGLTLLLLGPFVALAALFAYLAITHRPLSAPKWIVSKLETRANAALEGRLKIEISGGIDLVVTEGLRPRIRARMVQLERPSGLPIALLPELRATLWNEPLLRGKIEPRSFTISGASLSLHRLPDGRLDLDLGGGEMFSSLSASSASEGVEALKRVFDVPALRNLRTITAQDIQLRMMDERLDRVWRVSQGNIKLVQNAQDLSVTLGFDLGDTGQVPGQKPAQVAVSMTAQKQGLEASFGAAITGLPARDLAAQSPALAALGVLDAPISGALRSGLDEAGTLTGLNAMLQIGSGSIKPAPGVQPIPIQSGKLYLSYDRAQQRIALTDLALDSRAVRLRASGQMFLRDIKNGIPQSLPGQIAISDLQLDPQGLFETPARFSQGAADFKLSLDPFRIDLGQLELTDDNTKISAKGFAAAQSDGWRVSLDTGIDQIDQTRLLQLWPPALVPKTREWVEKNVTTGQLRRVHAAVRLQPGEEPRVALNYEFRGADVRVVRTLPQVQQGRGYATIIGFRQALKVEEGHITAPSGGRVEVADTQLVVPDIRIKPAPAVVTLITRSPIPAALSLLDQPPFEFLKKAGMGTDIAQGWAEARSVIKLPLKPKVPADEIGFDVTARLTEVKSDTLVPGRPLRADKLQLRADNAGMVISGKGTLSDVAFDAAWDQRFGPAGKGHSSVKGFLEVTPAALQAFGVGLPSGMVRGKGWGSIALKLTKGAPTVFDFASDLKGVQLSIPQIGWSKGAASRGTLALSGRLGKPPEISKIALDAPGLSAQGALSLTAAGALARAKFSALKIGNWFTGSADLVGQGARRPLNVEVQSGQLNLAKADLGQAGSGSGAGGSKISVALDRVQVTDGIALTGFRGNFTTRGGFSGPFQARVNGASPIAGTVVPAKGGRSAVRIQTGDAGATLAATGIFAKARGGQGVLVLNPLGQKSYDGQVQVKDLRVKDAPVLASLLSAASGVGLLEQLGGEGILFNTVDGAFRLTPKGVSVTRGSAVGASMGVTMTGNYYPQSGRLEMKGVISPFYLINGIGQIFAKKGEGLFGFSYSLRGSATQPKVSINPLSVLAPGASRELFRSAPPPVLSE
ncbi:hypothetical protein [Thioclava indica]|uniref:AsmA-like C-terminal domain-containing protein n=1 Tax=Thioclava indica TaxID=1353528 RepID=A0A074KCK5_9RHOB|nr:hypothetical protein [Thioclava indica]KEO59302.1 hypothetical protein DT23_04285 [Thioclava indica]